MSTKMKQIMGWTGVGISLVLSSIWTVWGTIENFHEGWFEQSLWDNLLMFVFQYLLLTFVFTFLAVISLKWRYFGLVFHGLLAVGALWMFFGASFQVVGLLIVIPILVLGLLYFFGSIPNKIWAYRLIIFIPLIILVSISVPRLIQISKRLTLQDFSSYTVHLDDDITWAPRGPGWPEEGVSWEEAMERCQYLSEDGLTLMSEPQFIWRLPTIEEAVGSMMLHGQSVNGVWDFDSLKATYDATPDKEYPLWDVYSPIIYYWLFDESPNNDRYAYIIVYDGGIHTKSKQNHSPSFGFRAVKDGA